MSSTHGFSKADTAKKCFAENIRLFADPKREPEKFNLYNGLFNLAAAVEETQTEIAQIKAAVAALLQKP